MTDTTKLAYLYIPIDELESVLCDNASSQDYIHNYDTDNYEIDNPDSSNGIVRLKYYVDFDKWTNDEEDLSDGPDINDYLMKVYYRTDRGDDLPLEYVLHFNCKQIYRRGFSTALMQSLPGIK